MMYQVNFNMVSGFLRNKLIFLLVICFSTGLGAAELRVISGNGEAGFIDGKDARFNKPIRLAPYGPGRILVADINNHAIRTVNIGGEVLTLAGGPGKQGHRDGPAAEAGFDSPHGVAVSPDGTIIVSGAASHSIRLLTPDVEHGYQVSTLAGVVGQSGYRDGPAAEALFNSPHAVVSEPDGGVLVVDIGNASIRRIKDGVVTTVAKAGTSNLVMPIDMMPAGSGGYLIADAGSQKALSWKPGEAGEVISPTIELAMPHGVADDANGNVYVAEIRGNKVTRLVEGEPAQNAAGTGIAGPEQNQLNKPAAVLVHDGFLWIADLGNHRISVMPLN